MESSLPIHLVSEFSRIGYWFLMLSQNPLQTALRPDSTHSKQYFLLLSENSWEDLFLKVLNISEEIPSGP